MNYQLAILRACRHRANLYTAPHATAKSSPIAAIIFLAVSHPAIAGSHSSISLPRSSPEAQGIASAATRDRPSVDDLLYDAEYNVAFGPTKQPQQIVRLKSANASQ